MDKPIRVKLTSIGYLIILVIGYIYVINNQNKIVLISLAIVLALSMGLDTILIIKAKKYKTAYWIAIAYVINILFIVSAIVLSTKSYSAMDLEQMVSYIRLQNISTLGFCLSILARIILKSEAFKLKKDLDGRESRDV